MMEVERKYGSISSPQNHSPFPLCDLPDALLVNVAKYLASPSRALFAVAVDAPSSSWKNNNWQRRPSTTSSAILANKEQWQTLDFVDVEEKLANRVTDDELVQF